MIKNIKKIKPGRAYYSASCGGRCYCVSIIKDGDFTLYVFRVWWPGKRTWNYSIIQDYSLEFWISKGYWFKSRKSFKESEYGHKLDMCRSLV